MTKNILTSLAVLVALAGCTDGPEPVVEAVELAPARTLEVELDRRATLANAANVNTETVGFTWRLDQDRPIAATPTPHVDISHEYRVYVDGAQLAAGVELPLTQEGALVAITPVTPTRIVDPVNANQRISIVAPSGRFEAGAGIQALASGAELGEVGDFAMNPNMLAFTTAPEVGTGSVTVQIPDADADAIAVIQVVERGSPHTLELAASEASYFVGDELRFDAAWSDAVGSVEVNWARLRMPSGRIIDIPVADDGQLQFHGTAEVPDLELRPGELVELEVDTVAVSAEGAVHRTAKTAFAVATRTAALLPAPTTFEPTDDGAIVAVELEVGSEGRYAVTGTLYGTNAAGELTPFLGSQTASMLEAGTQTLNLVFTAEQLASAELSAPYEVRHVQLQDQSRMYMLD